MQVKHPSIQSLDHNGVQTGSNSDHIAQEVDAVVQSRRHGSKGSDPNELLPCEARYVPTVEFQKWDTDERKKRFRMVLPMHRLLKVSKTELGDAIKIVLVNMKGGGANIPGITPKTELDVNHRLAKMKRTWIGLWNICTDQELMKSPQCSRSIDALVNIHNCKPSHGSMQQFTHNCIMSKRKNVQEGKPTLSTIT